MAGISPGTVRGEARKGFAQLEVAVPSSPEIGLETREEPMGVITGMGPRKSPATVEVIDEQASVLAAGRYGTGKAGYGQMLAAAGKVTDRVRAAGGCNGTGRHLAHRLVHDGEAVSGVPPMLSAQVRVFAAGTGRKTGEAGAHPVALAARRAPGLVRVQVEGDLAVRGMLAGRRDELGRARTQVVSRLHRLLPGLPPGGAEKFLPARQARTALAPARPRDLAGKTRRRLAAGLISELEAIDQKTRALDKELTELAAARGPALTDLPGTGPSGAARLLAGAGDIHRFASRDRFASRERHRTPGRLLRQPVPPPALPGREPAHQPGAAHHGCRPAAEPGQGPRLLPRPPRWRHAVHDGHAGPQAAAVQRRLRPHAGRPQTARSGPGRATGDHC
jgi:transposase